ncbi:hypothetical protein RRG08_036362 [Elysia crispata]|uniref:Uncharacterized protein n=1 Tax=Elysia crispata TaxID=231223 RepID=A0AAE1DI93_9GAST|nr:hypothetical protein RRG08_036362 [Elysia crispata]
MDEGERRKIIGADMTQSSSLCRKSQPLRPLDSSLHTAWLHDVPSRRRLASKIPISRLHLSSRNIVPHQEQQQKPASTHMLLHQPRCCGDDIPCQR